MDASRWRISKACQECRVKKMRCDGGDPCHRCKKRAIDCEYRSKPRNRAKKCPRRRNNKPDEVNRLLPEDGQKGTQALQNDSVAATHRASPSMLLQLYYGASSNFTVMNFNSQLIEGAKPVSGPQKEVQEMGPGLDRFNLRQLYFGDMADDAESRRIINESAAMFLDRVLASRMLEAYLATYWHIMPIWPKFQYRTEVVRFFTTTYITSVSEDPDSIIVLLAMAIGASMLGEEVHAQFLYQKAKVWSASLDEMVNVQAVQIALLMISLLSPMYSSFH